MGNFQENPIFDGKNLWFPVDFPLNQSITTRPDCWILLFPHRHGSSAGSELFRSQDIVEQGLGGPWDLGDWCWGLLGLWLIVIMDHSRKFPAKQQ